LTLTKTSFSIYNASAGSGKTFTLVKEYLKQILQSPDTGYYRHLLAITFTNKAVAEMKQRIVDTLVNFSEENSVSDPAVMMQMISNETGLELIQIQTRSQKILRNLLHNYAAFSVETIDKFNHRLIRTFARDLQLAQNFEVSLDRDEILEEAVDSLLSKTGVNKAITDIVLDFALQKTDDDKSWNIARDISEASKLLFVENEAANVSELKEKSLADFEELKKYLHKNKTTLETALNNEVAAIFQLFEQNDLTKNDFSRGSLWNHFANLIEKGKSPNFEAKWHGDLGEKPLYPGRVSGSVKAIIDGLTPEIIAVYNRTKKLYFELNLIDRILNNLTPLSVINLVSQEIETIKEERNLLLISDFNFLISQEIKNQPAPFIYERLGEKYRHFFIDEFQDTSKLQWENLIPLIDNALAQTDDDSLGSLLIVGDAKQSIYRWRGGLPEQFMDLYGDGNPFFAAGKKNENLGTNFRSRQEIIDFNNKFFTYTAKHFASAEHQKLYEASNNQLFNHRDGGYVKFEFIENVNKEEQEPIYGALTKNAILEALELGYSYKDICILTRKRDEGVAIASHLMAHEIPVISSESLLLHSSNTVQLLLHTFILALHPENEEVKVHMLDLLHDHLQLEEAKHDFFAKFLKINEVAFSQMLKEYDVNLSFKAIRSKSLYESFEYIIQQFDLSKNADAYLFAFMDFVQDFGLNPLADKASFLEHWENKKDKQAIPSSEGADAVQLLTIHKAKGLEFPIVIFPYADIELYRAKNPKTWYPISSENHDFDFAQIGISKEMAHYGTIGETLYLDHRSQLEMDNINLLYVVFTRAVDKLFVFSKTPSKMKEGPKTFNDLFRSYLENLGVWNDDQVIYEFGKNQANQTQQEPKTDQVIPAFISSNPTKHNLYLVPAESYLLEEDVESAQLTGNVFHNTMERIQAATDANRVLQQVEKRAILPSEGFELLKLNVHKILNHPDLKNLFTGEDTIYSERDIITEAGAIIRPDRINIHPDGSASLLDYKTGSYHPSHQDQLNEYVWAIEQMGYAIKSAYLVYVGNDTIKLRGR